MEFGKYIAHRGLHGNGVPENSIQAFELAIEKGVPIELDIRLSSDGRLMVFHDRTLQRMCGEKGDIYDYTCEELQKMSLAGTDQHIPLFTEVLKFVNGRVPLLVELKRGSPVWTLEKRAYHVLKQYKGEYAVQSFDPISMLYFRLNVPHIYRGILVTKADEGTTFERASSHLGVMPFMWDIAKPDFVSCDIRCVTESRLAKARKMGADFFVWVARTEEERQSASEYAKTIIGECYPEDFDFNGK
ncbi:Glycerophosphoryl diester phosphodiesterase [Ruminococcaceae bacterium FB2012]|nr:Glycerophosphoryl diester phosphodiesterase [Ruminococcaceae bacterium FB2012]